MLLAFSTAWSPTTVWFTQCADVDCRQTNNPPPRPTARSRRLATSASLESRRPYYVTNHSASVAVLCVRPAERSASRRLFLDGFDLCFDQLSCGFVCFSSQIKWVAARGMFRFLTIWCSRCFESPVTQSVQYSNRRGMLENKTSTFASALNDQLLTMEWDESFIFSLKYHKPLVIMQHCRFYQSNESTWSINTSDYGLNDWLPESGITCRHLLLPKHIACCDVLSRALSENNVT